MGMHSLNCSHQNHSFNTHKRLNWQVHKVFDHSNVTIHSDHPIIWHGNGTSAPPAPATVGSKRGQGEISKLALSLKKFQIWDGHHSSKAHYSLTVNTSTNWTLCIHICVRDPYMLSKGAISIHESAQEFSCQDCKLYACLNSSLYNSKSLICYIKKDIGNMASTKSNQTLGMLS